MVRLEFDIYTALQYTVYMLHTETVTDYRTQLYLPASLYKKIKEKSRQQDISMSKYIRAVLSQELNVSKSKKDKAWDTFIKAAGIGKGPKDLSYKHDDYFTAKTIHE